MPIFGGGLSIFDIEPVPINIPPNQEVASLLLSNEGAVKIEDYDRLREMLDAVFYQRVSENLEQLFFNAIPPLLIPPTCSAKTTEAVDDLQQDGARATAAIANLQ